RGRPLPRAGALDEACDRELGARGDAERGPHHQPRGSRGVQPPGVQFSRSGGHGQLAQARPEVHQRGHPGHVEEVTPNGFVHFAGGGEPGRRLAVKDNIDVARMPCAGGMEPLRGRIAQTDAPCVARLKAAGYTVVGKTLMDEAAFGATGDNPWFGRCHNPARHGYTPGGSSAGSAAAVAAGLCDAALGTDTLGSVRIPASYCGVVGYLPGAGLIDSAGVMPLMPEFDRVGVLARSIGNAARIASIMAGRPIEPRA